MLASQLIKELSTLIQKFGDEEIFLHADDKISPEKINGISGYKGPNGGILTILGESTTEMYLDMDKDDVKAFISQGIST